MTKKNKDMSQNQLSLFEYIKKAEELSRQSVSPAKGSLDIDSEFRAAVSEDLK